MISGRSSGVGVVEGLARGYGRAGNARLRWRRPSGAVAGATTVAVVSVVCVLAGHEVLRPTIARDMIALVVALGLIALASLVPRFAVYGLIGWFGVLGLLRRLLTSAGTAIGSFGDPLLLVAPIALVVLFAIAVERGALRSRTRLANAVLGLTVVLALSALNPLQGGLSVGLAGLMLIVIPMLAFWIGRGLMNEDTAGVLVRLLGALAIAAALYGLMQTFYGFPSWDANWVATGGYAALHVGSAIRAFGMSSSAAEYATLLGIGLLAWRAIARSPPRLMAAASALALLAVALWLESSRGIVVLGLGALWLAFCAARGVRMSRALLVGVILLALLPTVVAQVSQGSEESGAVASLTAHQTGGLSKPFGHESTLDGHLEEMVNGVKSAVTRPLGQGVGAITLAASKYGGTVAGTEVDPGNAPVAAGFIGLVLYLVIAWCGLSAAYRLARARRTIPTIAALGIVSVTFLQWLNGGQYMIIALVWLTLGWIDAECVRCGLTTLSVRRAPSRQQSPAQPARVHVESGVDA